MAKKWMQVTIDGCERTARALADPEDTWNGFLKPWFTVAAFAAINDMLDECGTGERLLYDPRGDAVLVYDGQDVTERFHAEIIDGVTFYPVGAGGWTWVQAKEVY